MAEVSVKGVGVEDGKSDLYKWAYRTGLRIICGAYSMYGDKSARNYLSRIIKELRAERSPERFRSKLAILLTGVMDDLNVEEMFPKVLKSDKRMRLDEFYRISSLILMGLWDSLVSFSKEKDKESICKKSSEGGEGE